MPLNAGELMTGVSVSTLVWGVFMPGLDSVKDMEHSEMRQHEALAVFGVLAMGTLVAIVSHDTTIFGVTVVAITFLAGVYEWKKWSTTSV